VTKRLVLVVVVSYNRLMSKKPLEIDMIGEYIIHMKKSGQKIKKYNATCSSCGKNRGFQPGMSWDNYGKNGWEIDHIEPLFNFDLTNRDEFLKANHHSNLQPLWVSQNRGKGSKYE
jgi:hypothetical protein